MPAPRPMRLGCPQCRPDGCPCLDQLAADWPGSLWAPIRSYGIKAADVDTPEATAARRRLAEQITVAFDVPWDVVAPDHLLTAGELADRQARRQAFARSLRGRWWAVRRTVARALHALADRCDR